MRNRGWFYKSALAAALACGMARAGSAPGPEETGNVGVPWPATDALGRSLPSPEEVGPPKKNHCVGLFYFLHLTGAPRSPLLDGPSDVSKILERDPGALGKPASPLWGADGTPHYWGEPLYGYYRGDDPWVLRRHAQLLADAGVDVLIFDTTNARSYPEIYLVLCEVFREARQSGGNTPQIAFMVNTKAGETAQKIYNELYKPGLYRELWFHWRGKPLMVCDPGQASPELRDFFTLRAAHWPFTLTNTAYAWHWEAAYPQPHGYTDDPQSPEQVNVSVAQNLRVADGKVTNMSSGEARGRSFHDGREDPTPGAVNQGYNFQEQWQRAFELNPPFVMVTGWNEWTASRGARPGAPLVFVDEYDEEYSRDIEPMRGGHGDNYYWQLVANVRRFKGAPPPPKASPPKTIHLAEEFGQWSDVGPEFRAGAGQTLPREFDGAGGAHYSNHSGRNEFEACKVARDPTNIYFYAWTKEPVTPAAGTNWMWLFIATGRKPAAGWEGYDFMVNRTVDASGQWWLEKSAGGWNWQRVCLVGHRVLGRELHLAIPREALGLTGDSPKVAIDFKWADNLQRPGEVMDFYLSGDVAPEGRFNFRYVAE
jgi:hypothetical protein